MVGAGKVQVGGASHQESRWVMGVNERGLTINSCRWGGGINRRKRTIQKKYIIKNWGRRARVKVLSISNESLGVERSMSEVGIPPPHNLDKPHAPVAVNYHLPECCGWFSIYGRMEIVLFLTDIVTTPLSF